MEHYPRQNSERCGHNTKDVGLQWTEAVSGGRWLVHGHNKMKGSRYVIDIRRKTALETRVLARTTRVCLEKTLFITCAVNTRSDG